jgi:hypothetical protein
MIAIPRLRLGMTASQDQDNCCASERHGLERIAIARSVRSVRRMTSSTGDNQGRIARAVTDRAHPSHASTTNESQFLRLQHEARV